MGTWQERIRQAFSNRNLEASLQQEERQRSLGAEVRLQQDIFDKRKQREEEARRTLEKIGALDLLNKIKTDVWRTGNIVRLSDSDGIEGGLAIETSYRGNYSESGSSDYSYVPRSYHGIWVDRLSLRAGVDILSLKANSIILGDSHQFSSKGVGMRSGKSSEPFAYPKYIQVYEKDLPRTRSELENALLGMCESRIVDRTLPNDLK
ncbi:MAG: hypothetical protein WD992_02335 [Candidatus Levyibacteriota bacterium]